MADIEELNRCRLCFSPNNLTDAIFPAAGDPNEELMTMIHACTSIRISFERDFPCAVCSSCVRIVNQFYAFRRKVRNNDRELQSSRGEKGFPAEDGDEEEDEYDEGDPLGARRVKREVGGDDQFYGQMKREIQSYLKREVAELEKKALAKVREGLQNRNGSLFSAETSRLQTTVNDSFAAYETEQNDSAGFDAYQDYDEDDEPADEPSREDSKLDLSTDGTDWKTKYHTLQRNNELLQKAFREQKTKLKDTEQLLKTIKNYKFGDSTEMFPVPEGVGFKPHPAIPEVTVEFLQDLNYKSGPGQKGDRNFISKLAVTVFGVETLVNSSVTGRSSNAHQDKKAKPPLCPQKMAAIAMKLFERVQLEVGLGGNQEELLVRSNDKNVRLTVCQKSMNLRKQYLKHNGGGGEAASGSASMDDEELLEAPPVRRKRKQ